MKILSSLLTALLLAVYAVNAQEIKKDRPNFIVIYSDDQRQDAVGVNGNAKILTPSLDRFAKQSVRFTNANVVFALCSPSRAALLTGRYGSANGVLGLGSALGPEEKTIAAYLKQAGYRTGVSGKWHVKQHPAEVGFDFYSFFMGNGTYYDRLIHEMTGDVRPSEHCDEYCVDRSIDFLEDAASKDQPFFLLHCTQLPHMNHKMKWDAKPETLAKYNPAQLPVADNRLDDLSSKPDYLVSVRNRVQAQTYGYPEKNAIQEHTREYYSVITEMDDALGRLFAAIKEFNIDDNTYIIFMSDNGWMLGDHGFTSKVLPYRPSTHVPLLISGPDVDVRSTDGIALNIDIAPTLMDLAGLEVPKVMHGKSLGPVLKGEVPHVREAFVYEGLGDYGGTRPNLTVISRKYRYIETYEDESLNAIVFTELYDQETDPSEMINLASERKYLKQVMEFRSIIRRHKSTVLKEDKLKSH